MKTLLILTFVAALALTGCVVHEHGHVHGGAAIGVETVHVHGPGCGHVFSGGIWIPVP